MNRRDFLIGSLAGLTSTQIQTPLAANLKLPKSPFTLGIASGDITDSSVVLWTRLAPEPQSTNGGMEQFSVPVYWELSLDRKMEKIVQSGEVLATPEFAHSVHVDVQGLEPDQTYWYRFSAEPYNTTIGQTKTLPHRESRPESVRFATASCQNYTHGYFVAYNHMIADQPDFVIHLGDYIYDTSFGENFRKHEVEHAPMTLTDFRRRHALYKSDKHLQKAHAALPFFTTIDNHDAIEDLDNSKLQQRAAAYQAWYEHMPVRGYAAPGDNHFLLQRQIKLGDLAQICLLDARQFRDKKDLCRDSMDPNIGFGNYRQTCDEVTGNDRTMLGQEQERWLQDKVTNNGSAWNVIASPGPFCPFDLHVDDKVLRYIGAWDAYPANRRRVVETINSAKKGHPILLSGDIHSFWAMDGNQISGTANRIPAVEFVTSSISANWPEQLAKPISDNLSSNPHVKFYEPNKRGYLLHEVNGSHWKTTARAIDSVKNENSSASNLTSFIVTHGKPGFVQSS